MMDMGEFRGLLTAVLFVLFIGVVAWTLSRRRDKDFREAERLPLDDDGDEPAEQDRKDDE